MENLSIEYVYKDGLKSPLKTLYFCRHCMELRSLECVYQHVRYKFNNIFDIRIYLYFEFEYIFNIILLFLQFLLIIWHIIIL